MLEALELAPGMRVLEVGAGTGYNAALLATITAAPVVTMDTNQQVVAEAREALGRLGLDGQVTVVQGDGYDGWSAAGPYDRIICESPRGGRGGSLPGFDARHFGMTHNGSGAHQGCLGDELSTAVPAST